jgi:general stress protein YciG
MAQGQLGNTTTGQRGKSRRGFAAMDHEQQRRIARKGGQASAKSQQRDEQGQFAGHRSSRSPSRGQGGSNR